MSEMYFEKAREYAEVIEDNIFNAHYDRPSLLALVDNQNYKNCLDMGCGPGAYISELQKFCGEITAIDLSPNFVAMVADKYPKVKTYVQDVGEGLGKEANESFDLVISPLTIHYVKDLNYLFSEVARVLRPGGTFAFSTHHPIVDFQDSVSGNYFEVEKLTQSWNTLKEATEVSFYRRALTDTLNALFANGFVIEGFSEGQPSEFVKEKSEKYFERLSTKPAFIFVKARKADLQES